MKTTNVPVAVTDRIRYNLIFKGDVGQDGAIFGDYMFRFEADGSCRVYSLEKQAQVGAFVLDRVDVLKPHSNAVGFGAEYYAPGDEFPLLYSNIYNNYSGAEDRLEGVCCVYRIASDAGVFSSKLVQVIRIGFVEDRKLWKSLPGNGDVRPYGNLVPDGQRGRLVAFVMRDAERVTRCFDFRLPELTEGELDTRWGVKVVTLRQEDIISSFDCDYSNYIQGACCYGGQLFSVEGFTVRDENSPNRPGLRVMDVVGGRQLAYIDLYEAGMSVEPELVDFSGERLYFMDAHGNVYDAEFC